MKFVTGRSTPKPLAICTALLLANVTGAVLADPLPGWNDGPTKASIVEFVLRVTDEDSPDFVPVEDRIATFDNDGCLWSEQPFYFQLAFAIDRVKELAPNHPEWANTAPFDAVLAGDLQAIAKSGVEGVLKLVTATHAGLTNQEFAEAVDKWLQTARHPRFNRPYQELVFQPMLEVLAYLRANGFKTYITSGGGTEFMRAFSAEVYGIPPEQVIGSTIKTKFELRDGVPHIVRLPEIEFIDDKEGKPVGIQRQIGRRPIASFGNSDGDLQMLQWTAAGDGPRFCLLVHHTDAEREWKYDRESHVGKLDKALDVAKQRGWTVADMQRDWNTIYPPVHHYLVKTERPHAAHWSYSGKTGPKFWGDLSPEYRLARTGKRQSPIDIRNTIPTPAQRLNFNYEPSKIHLIFNGHTIQENEDPGSYGLAGGRRFQLQQFHFHSPSEHTIDGNHFPMEMHLVHKAADGTVGVVAVFIREGEHNDAFDPVWNMLPDANSPNRESDVEIDTAAMLPDSPRYYSYEGSFTTPPCTEQVKWIVLADPVSLSKAQIERFRMVIDGNNRPVQPLNGRQILRSAN